MDERQSRGRLLDNPDDVFEHNAWDDVLWDEAQERSAQDKVAANSTKRMDEIAAAEFEGNAVCYWNSFYDRHENRFFKDRRWLLSEFPELQYLPPSTSESEATDTTTKHTSNCCFPGCHAKFRVLEVGCGVGNTVFPLLQINNSKDYFVYCCDFSSSAIDICKKNALFDAHRCHPFVGNIAEDDFRLPFPEESLDIIVLIFVLSAIMPDKMKLAVDRLTRYLKPGGLVLFRDYGRYDLAQLRFKNGSSDLHTMGCVRDTVPYRAGCVEGRTLQDNFYVRGDGTLVYFFTEDEVHDLFTSANLQKEQLYCDRRLLVNRTKLLKMYRVWIQAKYRKPIMPL